MSQSGIQARNYIRAASGLWAPLGYGATDLSMPVSLTNPVSGKFASISPTGSVNVSIDPTAYFFDNFEGVSVDVTNRWTIYGTVAPTQTQGAVSVNAGTTGNATTVMSSQPLVTINTSNLIVATLIFEAGTAATGVHRFFGIGTAPSNVGTAAAPLTDAVGFELDTTGTLRASVYSGGTRVATTALTALSDGAPHVYAVSVRGDMSLFFRDSFDVPIAQLFTPPASQSLPVRMHSLNSASVTGTPVFSTHGMTVLDWSRLSTAVNDGALPWRRAKINANGDQVTSLSHPTAALAGIYAGVSSYGMLRTTVEPHALFNDPFDGTLDTTNRWSTAGGTLNPTAANGRMSLAPGNSTAQSMAATTQASFAPIGINFMAYGWVAQFETINATAGTLLYLNSHRFMGIGTVPATWTATYSASSTSGPLLDAIGFETDTDGKMYPVVYANGVRTRVPLTLGGSDVTTGNGSGSGATFGGLKALADGANHQFGLAVRSDAMFWYVDSLDIPIAVFRYSSASFATPSVQTLPMRFHTINSGTAPSGTMVHNIAAVGAGDTGSNHSQISDGAYPWRKTGVTDVTTIANSGRPAAREQWYGNALNVNSNAVQLATYTYTCKPSASALSVSTLSFRASLHHSAVATKTVRIRRIKVAALMSAVAEGSQIEVHRVTAAPTGTAVTGGSATGSLVPLDPRDPAPEAVALNSLTAATSTGLLITNYLASCASATLHAGGGVIYDWRDSGQEKPITLRAGVLEGIAVGIMANPAVTPVLTIEIIFTEE